MFELLDYTAFTIAALGGILVGRRMRPKPPAPIKPMCSCGHGYGHHEGGLHCHAIDQQYHGMSVYTDRPCTCQRYDGPDPAIFGLDTR